ncbi:helix-turn-helix domain-containing protein [Hydrotalea lipotrueae]|jgi:DNA-binding Xre family transcriptional regulator|uniref:helix-turn-helix domain-containing protein n=1 Tax=Hydrotalea lipotrueae TaxID=2803817 RepID=UPI001C48B28F|nr:helix-turn-helix transcriptional regulator [Hydrotalea lipotrueae]
MTKLGLYLAQKSVNKAEVARKTGLTKARMNELTLNERSHLRAEELYLIALAIGVSPCELLEAFYGNIELPDPISKSKKR